MGGSIGGLFLPVNGYFALKNRGWRCDWEKEVEWRPLFFINRLTNLLICSLGDHF